nr:synaptic vesicle glycoprotein 2B-like [Leptinotarsa decemlineata]
MTAMQGSPNGQSKSFEEAVSLTGFGKFNLYVILATGGCLMCVIIETLNSMFIAPAAKCDLNLSLGDKGLLYSISFLGVVSGSHLWGYLADTRGRKFVTLFSLLSSAVFSFIGSLISLTWLFMVLRFVNGFLIGGSSAIIYAYVGEFHDNKYRAKVVSWISTFIALGNMYLPGLAWLILPEEWSYEISGLNVSFRPWRLLMIVYSLPCLFFAVLVFFLPESPKYLISQGKHQEALAILRKIFSINSGKSEDEFPVSSIIWEETSEVNHEKNEGLLRSMWEQTAPLFRKEYLLRTMMVSMLQFIMFFTTAAVIMWYPTVLNLMSEYGEVVSQSEVTMCKSVMYDQNNKNVNITLNPPENDTVTKLLVSDSCSDTVNESVFLVSLIVGGCYAVCYIFNGTFINIIGAKRLLIGIMIVTTVCGICAQLLHGYTVIQITLGIFLMVATGVGVVNAVVVDLFPTQIRGMALAVSLMFGRFGAVTGSNTGGLIVYNACDYLFYICGAAHIVVIIIVLLMASQKKPTKEKVPA